MVSDSVKIMKIQKQFRYALKFEITNRRLHILLETVRKSHNINIGNNTIFYYISYCNWVAMYET